MRLSAFVRTIVFVSVFAFTSTAFAQKVSKSVAAPASKAPINPYREPTPVVTFVLNATESRDLGLAWFVENDALKNHPEKWAGMAGKSLTVKPLSQIEKYVVKDLPRLKAGQKYQVIEISWSH